MIQNATEEFLTRMDQQRANRVALHLGIPMQLWLARVVREALDATENAEGIEGELQ
jgi:hypothetical protein